MRSKEKTGAVAAGVSLTRPNPSEVAPPASWISDEDLHLFNEGTHARLYEKLGAHRIKVGDAEGTYFAVWAPNAEGVFVAGSFNDWNKESHPLLRRANSGIWEGFIPGVEKGAL
ncbi:MAG TPA: 1,4-alpha-glucan branching enzyme, partial [Verrucomicrobiae bacterium]|nr:1,4-alpha-glucan branching enzyme [Verrucomicrobiae bacterium]